MTPIHHISHDYTLYAMVLILNRMTNDKQIVSSAYIAEKGEYPTHGYNDNDTITDSTNKELV